MNVLILDMTHGGQILSRKYAARGDRVTCADVYKIAPPGMRAELEAEGIRTLEDSVTGHYDLAVMPCHCPDNFLEGASVEKRIYFSEAVGEFIENGCRRIEITGVKGKTSTCYLLAGMLEADGRKVFLSTSRGRGPWKDGKIEPMEMCSIAPPYMLTLPTEGYDDVICEVSLGGSGKADMAGITNLIEDYGIAKDTRKASEAKVAAICGGINVVRREETEMWKAVGRGTVAGYGGRIKKLEKPEFGKPLKIAVEYDGETEIALRGDYLALQYLEAMDMALEMAYRLNVSKKSVLDALTSFGGVPGRGEISVKDGVRHIKERNPGISRLSVDRTLELLDEMGVLDNAVMIVDPVSKKVCDKMHMGGIIAAAERHGVELIVTDGSGIRPELPSGKTTVVEFIKEGYQ